MLKLNLNFIYRNLVKNPLLSFIKIFGLSIGIACSILVFLFVKHEFSFDKFNKNHDRIYRVAVEGLIGNTEIHQTYTCAPLPGGLYNEFPEIESVVRLAKTRMTLKLNERTFLEKNIILADSTFFEIFTFPLIKGNKNEALKEPNSVVLTESYAKKYFGDEDPINKTMVLAGDEVIKVTGIVKDIHDNSHFYFDFLVSLNTFDYSNSDHWWNNNFQAYILLKDNSDFKKLEAKFPAFVEKYLFDDDGYQNWVTNGNVWTYYLQPLTSIHLQSDLSGELLPNGDIMYVRLFIIIGIFLILIACVNYMNLTTARSSNRANEIGIKKVNGSYRKNLILQFIFESVFVAFIALLIAVIIVKSTLPYYNNILERDLHFTLLDNITIIPSLIVIAIIVGFISGSYPAFYLSSLKPVKVLKGNAFLRSKNSTFRNILVVLQFTISVGLITGTIFINKQLNFIKNEKLGFNKDQVLVIQNRRILDKDDQFLKEELLKSPYIEKLSFSHAIPGKHHNNIGHSAEGIDGWFTLNLCYCDPDYLDVMGLSIKEGRFFSKELETDKNAIIVNEAAEKLFGYPDGTLGKKISHQFEIIGIVKDFHYESMHLPIRPMALYMTHENSWGTNYISIKVNTDELTNVLAHVTEVWDKYSNGIPIEYTFLDQDYDKLYNNEQKTSKLFMVFSVLAIFIACLGLIGLSAYTIEQRIKEIGIRKVNGAKDAQLVTMLNRDFTKWIIVSYVIAGPMAYFFINRWMQSFAYSVDMSWWIFILSGIIALLIAIVTVSGQSLWAARRNPVEALRYE